MVIRLHSLHALTPAPAPALALALFCLLCATGHAFATWKELATTGAYRPRAETSFSACGGSNICMLGGRGTNYVDILDTKTLTWTAGATNDVLDMHHVQALLAPDGCVWLAGAWTGPFPSEKAVGDVWKYCVDTDAWSVVTTIARPRGAAGAAFYKGKLYLVSGNIGGHNADAKLVPYFDCYDPATDTWTTLPDIPHPRDHFQVTVIKDKLYAVGGRDSTSDDLRILFSATEVAVDVYDFATATWETLPDFPRPRAGGATVTYNNTAVVVGGEGHGRAWAEVDILQGSTFRPDADMLEPRHGMGVVSCAGVMWIAGGDRVQGSGHLANGTFAYFSGVVPSACRDGLVGRPLPVATRKPDATLQVTTNPVVTPAGGRPGGDEPKAPMPSSTPEEMDNGPSENGGKPSASDPSPSGNSPTSTPPTTPSPSDSSRPVDGSDGNNGEETTSPETSPVPDCFPSDATVQLQSGIRKRMAHLQIGDVVKVAHPNTFSPVFFFSHHHAGVRASVIRIATAVSGLGITLSPGHLIRLCGRASLVPAGLVRVGDFVHAGVEIPDGDAAVRDATATATATGAKCVRVTAVSRRLSTGLHNPHTLHGDIVVDGIVASTFTKAVHPVVARTLLMPVRAAYRVVGAHWTVKMFNDVVMRGLSVAYWRA